MLVAKTIARRITHPPYWMERDDLEQEASIAYLTKWRKWEAEHPNDAAGWDKVKWVAVFRGLVDYLRTEVAKHPIPWVSLHQNWDAAHPSSAADPLEKLAAEELLADLPTRHRAMIEAYFLRGESSEEIARENGVTAKTITCALSRIIKRINKG